MAVMGREEKQERGEGIERLSIYTIYNRGTSKEK